MSRGKVLFSEINTSRRFNNLLKHSLGEFAQNIWLLSLPHCDDWGHLPFDATFIKLRVVPGSTRQLDEIQIAIELLVEVVLWEPPYSVRNEMYVHVFNFEEKSRDSIKHRRVGVYPDESGVIPRRDKTGKDVVPLSDCLAKSALVRQQYKPTYKITNHLGMLPTITETTGNVPEYSGTLTNITENSENRDNQVLPDKGEYKETTPEIKKNSETLPKITNRNRNSPPDRIGLDRIGLDKIIPDASPVPGSSPVGGSFITHFGKDLYINGGCFRASFLNKIYNELDKDISETARVIYRAVHTEETVSDIKAFILGGIKTGSYLRSPHRDEYENSAQVKKWIRANIGIEI